MNNFKKRIPTFIGMLAGAVGGYMYYHFIGCNGSCMIASSPYLSILYGVILGGLIVDMFQKKKVEEKPVS